MYTLTLSEQIAKNGEAKNHRHDNQHDDDMDQ
jgi:hypothetical protein